MKYFKNLFILSFGLLDISVDAGGQVERGRRFISFRCILFSFFGAARVEIINVHAHARARTHTHTHTHTYTHTHTHTHIYIYIYT